MIVSTAMSKVFLFFFFNDTATTEIYTLSLHDALPISAASSSTTAATIPRNPVAPLMGPAATVRRGGSRSRSRRRRGGRSEEHTSELQSANISYAVFCLKKKKQVTQISSISSYN